MFDPFIYTLELDDVKPLYPPSLLTAGPVEKLVYFEDLTIAHKNLLMVTRDTWRYLKSPSNQQIIEVIGPSGSGKTILAEKIEDTINKQELDNILQNPGYIPVISVGAEVLENGFFNWRNLYWEILKKLNPEFVAYYNEKTRRTPTMHQVGTAVRDAILSHGTKYVIVDDAQNLVIGAPDTERLNNNMNVLTSLANKTGCKMLLVGTYELLKLIHLNGQLSRRERFVHFPRYSSNPEDIIDFLDILVTFQSHVPIPKMPDFVSHAEELYEASLGCVGILKPILDEALGSALDQESNTITIEHMRYHFHTQKQLLGMMRDIKDGEKELNESNQDHEILRSLAGLNSKVEVPDLIRGTKKIVKPKRKCGSRPGQRSPK